MSPQTRDAFKQLLAKATSKVADGTNIVIRLRAEDGGWCIAKACSEVGTMKKVANDDEYLYKTAITNLQTNHAAQVVMAWQYDQSEDGSFSLREERCLKLREDCECFGVCYKASWIKEPLRFRLSTPPQRVRRSKRAKINTTQQAAGSQHYLMSSGVK